MNETDLTPEQLSKILEARKEYDIFMDKYYTNHKCCPKCGSEDHSSTLMGYIMHSDNREAYKDLNRCTCADCKDVHTMHERVPIK